MLKKLRIKNYRTFENVTIEFGRINLLMGVNGTGKTSVFDVLAGLRRLIVERRPVEECFPEASIPRRLEVLAGPFDQCFEVTVEGSEGTFVYSLEIEHRGTSRVPRIKSESLHLGAALVLRRIGTSVEVGDQVGRAAGTTLGLALSQALAVVAALAPEGWIGEQVATFRGILERLSRYHANAYSMSSDARTADVEPREDLSNLGAWLRSLIESHGASGSELDEVGGRVLPEFLRFGFWFREDGESRMGVVQSHAGAFVPSEFECRAPNFVLIHLDELSHGQRALLALYALLHFKLRPDAILCIDEPDNFVSLREIQPWLLEAMDRAEDNDAQLILASHHPELVDLIGGPHGILFERDGAGATTVRKFPVSDSPLLVSEQLARGWIG